MFKSKAMVYITLVIALLLIGWSSLLSAAGYLMLPAQEMETGAELKQSQGTGKPISDEDIERHLGRLRHSRKIYWTVFGPASLAGLAVITALVLLRCVDQPPTGASDARR